MKFASKVILEIASQSLIIKVEDYMSLGKSLQEFLIQKLLGGASSQWDRSMAEMESSQQFGSKIHGHK